SDPRSARCIGRREASRDEVFRSPLQHPSRSCQLDSLRDHLGEQVREIRRFRIWWWWWWWCLLRNDPTSVDPELVSQRGRWNLVAVPQAERWDLAAPQCLIDRGASEAEDRHD